MNPDDPTRGEPFDLVAIGETMVAFVSRDDPRHYLAVSAGAESNVAMGMARLGSDPLGKFIEGAVVEAGVDVEVVRDELRPTGVMTVHIDGSVRSSTYYRSQSAARGLSPEDLLRVGPSQWTHLTGITAALSGSAAELVETVVVNRSCGLSRVSFDVNFRPALWPDSGNAAGVLLRLARSADVVFIGEDEAVALFGTGDARILAETILERDDQELVYKREAGPASVITVGAEVSEPALAATVVEATGAGDAFAAGYLAATVFGWPVVARLRLGHLLGSRTVGVLEHVPPPFLDSEREAITPDGLAERWERIETTGREGARLQADGGA
jgi:2-dehydro-3-deoxygluconokinase